MSMYNMFMQMMYMIPAKNIMQVTVLFHLKRMEENRIMKEHFC